MLKWIVNVNGVKKKWKGCMLSWLRDQEIFGSTHTVQTHKTYYSSAYGIRKIVVTSNIVHFDLYIPFYDFHCIN